jgi:hypothetical protein
MDDMVEINGITLYDVKGFFAEFSILLIRVMYFISTSRLSCDFIASDFINNDISNIDLSLSF